MSYGGHALDMIIRMKAHREMKKARRDKLLKSKEQHTHASHGAKNLVSENCVDPETTEKVKHYYQNKIKTESRKRVIMTIILLSVTLAVLLILILLYLHYRDFLITSARHFFLQT